MKRKVGAIVAIACVVAACIAIFVFTLCVALNAPKKKLFEGLNKQFTQRVETRNLGKNSTLHVKVSTTQVRVQLADASAKKGVVKFQYSENDVYQFAITNEDDDVSFSQSTIELGHLSSLVGAAPTAIITVPCDFKGSLDISTVTGDVQIISLKDLNNLNAHSTTADISVYDSDFHRLVVNTTTGSAILNNVKVENMLSCSATTGDISAKDCTTTSAKLSVATGDINFSLRGVRSLDTKSGTGNICGTVYGNRNDFTIRSHSGTGDSNLPKESGDGASKLTAESSTGNIQISFMDDSSEKDS